MEQAAKPISSMHGPRSGLLKWHKRADRVWGIQVQGAVWPLAVVVVYVGAKYPLKLPATEDGDAVEDLAAHPRRRAVRGSSGGWQLGRWAAYAHSSGWELIFKGQGARRVSCMHGPQRVPGL